MALRAVPDHPKFAELKAILNLPRGATLGWLEGMWHFAGRFTPQGNIGKYSDAAIETWLEWNGDAGALIAALITARWIDRDSEHRLIVHDWAQHADKATKNALGRSKLTFCTPGVRTEIPEVSTAYRLPVPEPEPVPVKEQSPSRKRATKTAIADARHAEFKEAVKIYWGSKNAVEMPWGPMEGQQLGIFLREAPHITLEQFTGFLRARFRSEVNHGERPSQWLKWITSYGNGPIDRFNKPIEEAGDGNAKQPGTNGAGQRSATSARVGHNLNALGEALAKRGLEEFRPGAGGPDEAVPKPGPGRLAGGVSAGLREAGAEVLDFGSGRGAEGASNKAGPTVLPPAG